MFFFCQPGHRWTAYLAGTNHIWLLSVTVNYTLCASCPPATMQWNRSCCTSITNTCWMCAEQVWGWSKSSVEYKIAMLSFGHPFIDFMCLFLLSSISKGAGREDGSISVYHSVLLLSAYLTHFGLQEGTHIKLRLKEHANTAQGCHGNYWVSSPIHTSSHLDSHNSVTSLLMMCINRW